MNLIDAWEKYLDGVNDEEVTILIEEWISNVRQQVQKERERATKLSEAVIDAVGYMPNYRPPEEIKRDIKYEKNPMRLKQLNQELNISYKFYKRKK